MKLIIAGSREFDNYDLLEQYVDSLIKDKLPDVTIICGLAKGADELGKRYALENKLPLIEKPALWKKIW